MIAGLDKPNGKLRGWLPLIVAAVAVVAVLTTIATVRTVGLSDMDDYAAAREASTSDFRDFWFTARHFRQTGEISSEFGVHNYLPFFTIFMLPWSLLPLPLAAGVFTLFSLGLCALAVVLVEMLLNQRLDRRPRRATLAALGLILAYVCASAVLGTVNILLLFLIIATWVLFEQQREWLAGVPLGLALLIKLLPGALLVFFLLKRRWRVAASAAIVSLVGGWGFPAITIGYGEALRQHDSFIRGALFEHSARTTITAAAPRKADYSNQSLPIVFRRLLTHTSGRPGSDMYVNIVDLPRGVVFWLYLLGMAGLLGATVMATLSGPSRWPPAETASINAVRAQFGLWCCVMLLASPLVWTHYFVLMYWPVAYLADRAQRAEAARSIEYRLAIVALLAWLVGLALLALPAARAAGAQLTTVVIAWAVLLRLSYPRESKAKLRVV